LKWLLKKITNGLSTTTQYLVSFGPAGLFGIAFLDSALIPLPGGPDAVMIILSTAHPAWMPLYAIAATLGSMFGCLLLYKFSERAGRRALERFSIEKQARVKRLVDQYDVLSVLVSSVLPPPFPFKLFVVTAGVFRLSIVRFAVAVAIGRAFRFFLEGFLAIRYGEQAAEMLKRYYPSIGIAVAALIVIGFIAKTLLRKKPEPDKIDTAVTSGK
jgi:membrane protein YqaA with SNARE-associated domain